MRILLVEDEKKVASFIKKGLEEEFYSVDAAYDGKEGLRLALMEEYDLIILDIMLPFKDGFTILKLKGGLNLSEDIEKVLKLREQLGKDFILRFDANQGYTFEQSVTFIDRIQSANLEIIEQPTSQQ
ncbi:MAG: response regulator, partial [Ignavibacteriaceae bacterium]|nr:response regulator [Ignavibacteriaceae bacterium]